MCFVNSKNIIIDFFCNVAVKPLGTIYIDFVLKVIYKVNNNLFPGVTSDFKT